jgi:hypothetical protein
MLDYQKRDLDDFLEDIRRSLGIRRYLVKMVKPAVKYWLLKKSPYIASSASKKKIPGKALKGKPAAAI